MKKLYVIAAVAMAALMLSCSKEAQIPETHPAEEATGVITINATLADLNTKVTFTPAYTDNKTTSMTLTWADGDKLRVYNHADPTQYSDFDLAAGSIGKKTGSFSGTPVTAASYDVEIINGAVDFGAQTQPSDGVTSDLKYMAQASEVTNLASISFTEFSSVLSITAQMPSTAVAAKVKSVDITASEAIFNSGNTLTITLGTLGDAGADGILHLFANLPVGDKAIPAGTTLLMHFNAPGEAHDVYTRFVELPATTFKANKLNTINVNASQSDKHAGPTSCDGSDASKAYLIGDKYQMAEISNLLSTASKKYFKFLDDITVASWSSIDCNAKGAIVLDGNNKTISDLNAPLFAFLDGEVSNLNITNATVSSSGNYYGVLVRSITKDNCEISNITVSNSSVSGARHVGGLIGRIDGPTSCKVTNCSADVNVTGSSYYLGGLIGYMTGGTIEGCHATGSVTCNLSGTYAHVGGLIGTVAGGTIKNCYATGDVNETVSGKGALLGGLIGDFAGPAALSNSYATGNVTSTYTRAGGLVGGIGKCAVSISDCYCTGEVSANNDSGGFVGYVENDAAANLTITNGYSTSALTIAGARKGILIGNTMSMGTITCIGFVNLSDTALYNGSVNPISGNESKNYSGTEGTILSHAQAFGWDFTTVWNEIDPPTLK